MKLLNLTQIKENLLITLNRFSLTIVSILFVSILFTYLIFTDNYTIFSEIVTAKLIITWVIFSILSLWVYLFFESLKKSRLYSNIAQIWTILFWGFFYNYLKLDIWNSLESMIFIFLTFIWISSLIFCAYFIKNSLNFKEYDQDWYFNYFYNIFLALFYSSVFWIALLLLGLMAIGAIDMLFDFGYWFNDLYWYWTVFALSFSTPIFFLLKIPKSNEILINNWINKFFEFLIKYLLVSFVVIYFMILYSYSAKVLINFSDWPKWEVTWLVIGFSIFWYLAYIFSYWLEKNSWFIKIFRKIFPLAVAPQIFMLFYAIYLRIAQYDITVNRYFVVVFGIWLLSLSLYFIFSKKKFLAFIFFLLIDFTILISIWPWSVYSLPESRQMNILESNLVKAWILDIETKKITPLKEYSDIDKKLSKEIYSWIRYLCDFDDCNSIKNLFPKKYRMEEEDYDGFSRLSENKWGIVGAISRNIKVKMYYDYDVDYSIENYEFIRFSLEKNDNHYQELYPIDISGYDFLEWTVSEYSESWIHTIIDLRDGYIVYKNDNWLVLDEFDISILESKLLKLAPNFSDVNYLKKENLIFDLEWKNYDLRLFIKNVSIKNPKYIKSNNDSYSYNYFDWVALFREKK